MSLQTKQEVVQQIRYELYGGIQSSDPQLSERFILTKVNSHIAALAMVSAFQTTNFEGITYADDFFYITFSNIALSLDTSTGLKYFVLPAVPVGLPRQRSLRIYPPRVQGGLKSDVFKPIGAHEVQRMTSQAPIPGKVFFFVQDGRIYFISANGLTINYNTVNLSIASADGGMDETLNLPQDMINLLIQNILKELRPSMATPQDLTNDGIDVKQNVM